MGYKMIANQMVGLLGHPVNVLPASMGYKMIANQMAGLLRHPVNVLPASMAYKMMYHGSELICILSNGTSMFQVPVATQMYACKRLNGLIRD